MKRLSKSEATVFSNGPTCDGVEYSFGDKTMNIALVTVNGRYPEQGYVMNEVCTEMAYVISGQGKLCGKDGDGQAVATGDAVLMNPNEPYFWEGEALTMVIPCTPAFFPEQHKRLV